MQNVADMIMPSGKTWKEENLAKKHNIPLWSLVELEDGRRLYVVKYERDCDGEPLYALTAYSHGDYQYKRSTYSPFFNEYQMDMIFIQLKGWPEDSLTVIKRATQ